MVSLPLRTQLFDSFLGLQEGIHSIILPDLYSSGGSQNLYIDQFGRARSILGYTKANATPITTDTGGDAVAVTGLHAYRSLAAGGDTRRLRAIVDDETNEWEVWTSSNEGVTWTLLKDFGSGPVGYLSDYAQFGDEGYLTNGVSAVQLDNGTTLANAGGTQSPTPTAAAGSAGALSGNYQYKLVSMIGGTRQIGSVASTSVALSNEQADLTWTADANTNVTGYELYRTSGTGKIYYYVAYIDARLTVAHTDNTPDILILENRLLEEHGDAPPTGAYFVTTHLQRAWYARTDTFPRRLWNSDPGDADSVYDENNHDLTDADSIGDKLTGVLGGFEQTLVAFLERSIWTISGTGQTVGDVNDWIRTRTNARVGCVSQRGYQRVPAGATYTDQKGNFQRTDVATLAYFTPFGDIRLFDGDNDLIISYPVKTALADLFFQHRGNIISWSDPVRDEIGWVIPTGSVSSVPTLAVVWNHAYGVWYTRTPYPFQAILSTDSATEGEIIFAGQGNSSTGGYVYRLWSGSTFDGTAIPVQWMTKTLFGVDDAGRPDVSSVKRWHWIELLLAEGAVSLEVDWLEGNTPDDATAVGSRTVTPTAATVMTADGSLIETTDGSEIAVSLTTGTVRIYLQNDKGDYLYHRGLRLRVRAEVNQAQWALEGMNLGYKTLPGLNRGVNP